jgi:uncharacterized protein (DUF983 family)
MHPSAPDTDCCLAHGMSTGYPATADWQEVTKWLHLLAAIELLILRPECKSFINSQWARYFRYRRVNG